MSAIEISKISCISRGFSRVDAGNIPAVNDNDVQDRFLGDLSSLSRLNPLLLQLLLLPLELTRMTASASVSRPLRKLLAAGPAIFRDGNALITNDACPAELLPELEALCLPRISEADGKAVVALLKEHAGRVRYVVERGGSSRRRRRAHAGRGARLRRRDRAAPTLPIAGSDRLHQGRNAAQAPADDGRRQDWLSIRTGAASGWSRSSAGPAPALSSSTSSSSAGARSRRCGRSR